MSPVERETNGGEDGAGQLGEPADTTMISVDARRVVLLGTIAFGAVFLALLPAWFWLGSHHHRVWLWTALVGALLGIASLPLVSRHKRLGRQG